MPTPASLIACLTRWPHRDYIWLGISTINHLLPCPPDSEPFVVKPCPGTPPGTSCKPGDGVSANPNGCCACRMVKLANGAPVFAAKASTGPYSYEPDCTQAAKLSPLPPGKIVGYTGAKLAGFEGNRCTKADYAQVVLQAS